MLSLTEKYRFVLHSLTLDNEPSQAVSASHSMDQSEARMSQLESVRSLLQASLLQTQDVPPSALLFLCLICAGPLNAGPMSDSVRRCPGAKAEIVCQPG